jgi:Ca-activated chloride channel homolog
MFRFANPIWLLLLIIEIFIIFLYFWKRKISDPTLIFSNSTLFKTIGTGGGKVKRVLSLIIIASAIICLIAAMARPQTGQTLRTRTEYGIDIILTLDISSSMEAMDFYPKTRLRAAKDVVSNFIKHRQSDRVGLVVFAAQSFTLCPLTLDYEMLTTLLRQAEESRVEDGTAIGSAIATSVNRLQTSTAKSKIIILLTDGMNNRGNIDPLTAARLAETFGIRIYTIGVGTEGTAPIMIDGRIVYAETHIDEKTLEEIANVTKGKYYRAKNISELEGIYDDIDRLETSKIKFHEWVEYNELYPRFLMVGFILLIISFIADRTVLRRLP